MKLSEEDKIIGTFGVHDFDWRKRIGEVSYGISPDYTRRGFFTEALRRVLDYCFNDLEFYRVSATTRADNIASIKGLEKCGLSHEGVQRKYYLNTDGSRYDAVNLAILRNEYFGK